MNLKMHDVLPVVVSVLVLVLVAILEKNNKVFAAMTAAMPLTMPLALWIVYSSNHGDQAIVSQFSQNLFLSLLPTVAFVITVWLTARAGLKLGPMLLSGYAVWAAGQGLMLLLRRWLGF